MSALPNMDISSESKSKGGCSSVLDFRKTRKSADFARSIARSTPMDSIVSVLSRMPAVSSNVTGRPPRSRRTSITSRVVPAISEVIAISRPEIAFNSVDFPAFGAPIIATSNPSRIRSATKLPAISTSKLCTTCVIRPCTSGVTSVGTSSSAKSIVTSINAVARNKCCRHSSTSFPKCPEKTRLAWRLCASVSALIRSPSPST